MSLPHARPLDVIRLRPLGPALADTAGQPHGLQAREHASVLVTLRLHDGTVASGRVTARGG